MTVGVLRTEAGATCGVIDALQSGGRRRLTHPLRAVTFRCSGFRSAVLPFSVRPCGAVRLIGGLSPGARRKGLERFNAGPCILRLVRDSLVTVSAVRSGLE